VSELLLPESDMVEYFCAEGERDAANMAAVRSATQKAPTPPTGPVR
jgi:hypothetical protein